MATTATTVGAASPTLAKRILVSYQERKKILTISRGEGIPSLQREFAWAFDLSSCESVTFQQFNPTFEEYVDLDSDAEVSDKDKLQAVVTITVCYYLLNLLGIYNRWNTGHISFNKFWKVIEVCLFQMINQGC